MQLTRRVEHKPDTQLRRTIYLADQQRCNRRLPNTLGNIADRVRTVSYTHLDVYKRQVYNVPQGVDQLLDHDRLGQKAVHAAVKRPLSLDVYKRQG